MRNRKKHDPSRYRALVREARKDRRSKGKASDIHHLLDEARGLSDPYYTSLALFRLSDDVSLSVEEVVSTAEEGVSRAMDVDRDWRRAELLTELARRASKWGKRSSKEELDEARAGLYDMIVSAIDSIPKGKDRSDALCNAAKYLKVRHLARLLEMAVGNGEHTLTDGKSIIRVWARAARGESTSPMGPAEILKILNGISNIEVRSRLFGYLYHQLSKLDRGDFGNDIREAVRQSVETALSIADEEKRLDTLRYIVSVTGADEIGSLGDCIGEFERPEHGARLCSALGGRADRLGIDTAKNWFRKGIELAYQIRSPEERASIRLNLAEGMRRCGESEDGENVFREALRDCDDIPADTVKPKLAGRAARKAEKLDIVVNDFHPVPEKTENALPPEAEDTGCETDSVVPSQRHIMGLYNTYEGGLSPAHLRAVARVAPLCRAFDLDIALIGFPVDDVNVLVKRVVRETNIGKGGRFLREMAEQGRIRLHGPGEMLGGEREARDHAGFDAGSRTGEGTGEGTGKNIGTIVATTEHPDTEKSIQIEELLVSDDVSQVRLCLVMGLGKQGLPHFFLNSTRYHLELTGSNTPLETCTVMGIIAERLRRISQ